MTYSISCVLLIPAAHREAVNQLAESLGYGPNNMNVELVHTDGSSWYGCHTWAALSFLAEFAAVPPEYADAVSALVVSHQEGGNAFEHWQQTLSDNGLAVDEAAE